MASIPWDDCKIAFGIDDPDPLAGGAIPEGYAEFEAALPLGWDLDEVDGTGARWVAVFRVTVMPTAQAAKKVRKLLKGIGAIH